MREKIRDAFAQVHAEEALKENTKVYLQQKIGGHTKTKAFAYRRWISAAACFVLLLLGAYGLYVTPTAAISIDINPSIELNVNRFDRVISVTAYNADGEQLAESLDITNMDSADAIDQIMENEQIESLLSQEAAMTISVVGSDDVQTSRLLENMERRTSRMENVYCYRMQPEEVQAAHEAGLSYGKYRAYLELRQLSPKVTTEDVRSMSMREIRDRIDALSADPQEKKGMGNGHGGHGNSNGRVQGTEDTAERARKIRKLRS